MERIDLISILLVIWLSILLMFSDSTDYSLLIILILIGYLVLRELFDISLTRNTKERMNFYLYLGVVFFIYTVAMKVISILRA